MISKFETRTAITLISGGQNIFGILHLPLEAKNVPCVLFCNGLGGFKSGQYRLAVRQAEALSKAGFASLRFDFRGTGDSEGDFSDITFESELQDATCAAEFLLNHSAIDTTRFAVLGRSFGALVGLSIAKAYSAQLAVLWAPVFDPSPWMEKRTEHKAIRIENDTVLFAGQTLNPRFLQELSTLSAKNTLPHLSETSLCIVHGEKDSLLGSYHLEKYRASREDAKILVLPESNHDFGNPQEQELLLSTTTKWCITYVRA